MDRQSCMVLLIIGKHIGKYIGNICKKYNFFTEIVSQPRSFIEIKPNLDQLLPLGLRNIALSRIFDICPICPDFGPFIPLLCNNWQKFRNNYQNLCNQGKYQKSDSERFFVIIRWVTGPNLVLFRWMSEAAKQFPWKNCVFFTYISYIYISLFPDNYQNHATLPIHISTNR